MTIALAAVMVSACSEKSDTPSPSAAATTQPTAAATSKPVTISMWTELNVNAAAVLSDLNSTASIQEWSKKANATFKFQHPPAGSNDAFGLMLATGELPDVIFQNWSWVPGGLAKLKAEGQIIALNDLIDKNAPNLKKVLNDNPEVMKQLKADNGEIYAIPHLRVGPNGKYKTFSGLILRQDWLDELGLQRPETIEEWETTLRAFKEKKGATAPFTLDKGQLLGYNDFLGAYGIGIEFYVNNGTVKYGSIEPAFKEYLTTMKRWYDTGLIDRDFLTNDSKTKDANMTSSKSGALYGFIGGSIGNYTPALQKDNPKAKLVAAQYPVLKKGDQPSFINRSWDWDSFGGAISKSNKNPAETVKALDYLFSPEGSMLKNFGIEGQTYKMVNGQPVYTDLILKNPDKLPVSQAMAKYFQASYPFIGLDDDRYNDQMYTIESQTEALKIFSKYADNATKVLMPPVSFTAEESNQLAKIVANAKTYRDEMVVKMIFGAEPMTSIDKMVDQLKKMDIEKAIKINQDALDRYNKR
jgi:putative aldouronate transport system substrate-binding protein